VHTPRVANSLIVKKEDMMKPSTKDQLVGQFHEAKGKAKEQVGKITGNPKLEAEGQDEKVGGAVQTKVGEIKRVFGK
jgi:uncharacterized protein YjbJ (UPF0337 family)